jgi:hypothetical protein
MTETEVDLVPAVTATAAPTTRPKSEFYSKVVAMTKKRDPDLLRKATDEVYTRILDHHEQNIEIAATHHHTSAYIFVYADDALYRGHIRYHDIVNPSEVALKTFSDNSIIPILERLNHELDPFMVVLEDLTDESKQVTHHAIRVCWTLESETV